MSAAISIHRIKGAEVNVHGDFSVVQIRHDTAGNFALHFEKDDGIGARMVAEAINAAVARSIVVPA